MPEPAEEFSIGIEEEYQIVNPRTRELRPRAQRILRRAEGALEEGEEVMNELYLSQIETATPICRTLGEARAELVRLRRELNTAAREDGSRIAAAGTHPFSHWREQQVTPKARYRSIADDYQQIARDLVIFGCHVHVGMEDRELALQVMNRSRVWLAPLLALTANSPFWLGEDTGYASFRTELWSRFPMSGPPQLFGSRAEHDALVQALVDTESIQDATRIYWDVRLPQRVPTIEFRSADVCMTVDEAVMYAGLVRATVRTCYDAAARDLPHTPPRPELLRAAHWRAARFGLDETLIDLDARRSVPARELIETYLAFVRPALEDSGDWEEVSGIARDVLERGNGAARQREAYRRAGRIEDVVDLLVEETARGTDAA